MRGFGFFSKKRPAAKGFKPEKSDVKWEMQTFILENLITPGSLIDSPDHPLAPLAIDLDQPVLPDVDLPMAGEIPTQAESLIVPPNAELTTQVETHTNPQIPTDANHTLATDNLNQDSEDFPLNNPPEIIDLTLYQPIFESGVFTVGETGKVSIDFLFDGGGYKGQLAIFSLNGIEKFAPGSTDFIQEVARRALSDSHLGHIVIDDRLEGAAFSGQIRSESGDWNTGTYAGVKTFDMQPNDTFGVMLVPNGTVQDVFNRPDADGAIRPLFSMTVANPNQAFHVGQIADVTGDGHTFIIEDLRVDIHSERDYNDVIFQIKGATGKAVHLDEVINPDRDWRGTELGEALVNYVTHSTEPVPALVTPDLGSIEIIKPISNLALTPESPAQVINLNEVFADKNGAQLQYQVIDVDTNYLDLAVQDNQLTIKPLPITGITEVAVKATDSTGNSVIHNWSVITNNLPSEVIQTLDISLGELNQAIADNNQDLITGLDSPNSELALAKIETVLSEHPELTKFLTKPEILPYLGINSNHVEMVRQLLQSPEFADQLGFNVAFTELLSNPDTGLVDIDTINAKDAIDLLPKDAQQPKVGFLDFSEDQHAQNVSKTFAAVNPINEYQLLEVDNGNWAQQLIKFVDALKANGKDKGIVNLSFDLSQVDDVGFITRYELTPVEQQAIAYARNHNVLLVVAAGNTGDKMSALGAAAQKYDNILTVGSVNQLQEKSDYSAFGEGLGLVAPGGEWYNNPNAFVGTSKATAYVTAAASLVWAANPALSFQQVKELLKETAVDLDAPDWDEKTGAGLLDVKEAISRAQLREPEAPTENSQAEIMRFSGENRVLPLARPASDGTKNAISSLEETQLSLIDQWQTLALLGNPDLTLDQLATEVSKKIDNAFDKYQQASTQSAITTAQSQQVNEALELAVNHYEIELSQLENLLKQYQDTEEKLYSLHAQKYNLEAETNALLNNIKEQIKQAEEDVAAAQAKLGPMMPSKREDAIKGVSLLQEKLAQQQQVTDKYFQQASAAELRREQHQNIANFHNSQIRQWQVVGTKRKRSGKSEDVWGWAHHREHIAPRDSAQQLANQAAKEQQQLETSARQSQQQADALQQQIDKLQTRIKDWDSYKQAIQYEIAADKNRLQADKDLLLINTEVQQQKLETIKHQIDQEQEKLATLLTQKLPTQAQSTIATENRVKETQEQLQALQQARANAQKELQAFLETSGYLLPYQARIDAIEKYISDLQAEEIRVQENMLKLTEQLKESAPEKEDTLEGIALEKETTAKPTDSKQENTAKLIEILKELAPEKENTAKPTELLKQSPNNVFSQQLTQFQNYAEDLEAELEWAKLQKEQLNLGVPDSPTRLAITSLIKELETAPAAIDAQTKIKNLQSLEANEANFLQGFDNLSDRLTKAQAEVIKTTKELDTWREEYRNLGLAQADLEDNLIPKKETEITAKQQDIATTEAAIFTSEDTLTGLEAQLSSLQAAQIVKATELEEQKKAIALTQLELNTNTSPVAQYQALMARANLYEQEAAAAWNRSRKNGPTWVEWRRVCNRILFARRCRDEAITHVDHDWIRWNELRQLASQLRQQAAQIPNISTLLEEKKALQTELNQQLAQVNQKQQELQGINQKVNDLQSQVGKEERNLDALNTKLLTQQQQLDNLDTALANLKQQEAETEQQLIDKYRLIELTQQYSDQIKAEAERLTYRLNILNRADILEKEYQEQQNQWQSANKAAEDATNKLIEIRETSAGDRNLLASLKSQESSKQSELNKAQTQKTELEESLPKLLQDLAITDLTIANQKLELKILTDADAPALSAEREFYRQAQQHLKNMWYPSGGKLLFNSSAAAAYRDSLQQASFMADKRNQYWQKRQEIEKNLPLLSKQREEQQNNINESQQQLAKLNSEIPQLSAGIADLQTKIAPVQERLKPFLEQEEVLQKAYDDANGKAVELAVAQTRTTQQQADALRRLIGYGILASESDVDFFSTKVKSRIEGFINQLKERDNTFNTQIEHLNELINSWEKQLEKTSDPVSQKSLANAIAQSKAQVQQLENWKAQNQPLLTELTALLNRAIKSLLPLQQKQELEIRQKLESNEMQLQEMRSQLAVEDAADNLAKTGTVLAAAELTDLANQDLRNGVTNWTQQLQTAHTITKQLGDTQQQLSQSVDDLISYIKNNLADPLGEYKRDAENLGNGLSILDVNEAQSDAQEFAVTSTEEAIEQIKLRIAQDAVLWKEIAPIAIRYGVESQQLKDYQAQTLKLQAEAEALEQQRKQYQANADWWNSQINTNGLGFDEQYYLGRNPDVAAAVARGSFRNGYEHFLRHGQFEGRNPSAQFDNSYYLARNPDVAAAVARGVFRSGVEHFVRHGQYERRAHNPQAEANRNNAQTAANDAAQKRDEIVQLLTKAKGRLAAFLAEYPDNGTAIDLLQIATFEGHTPPQQVQNLLNVNSQSGTLGGADILLNAEAVEGRNPNEQLLKKAIQAQAFHEGQGRALLTQADWYEREAALAWNRSRKSGPTWTEWRRVCRRRWFRRRCRDEAITHVDHNWIRWNEFRQIFPQKRQQGFNHLAEAEKWRKEVERLQPLAQQWAESNDAANQASVPINEARNFVEQLEVARESIADDKIQAQFLEELLPTLKEQLDKAQAEAAAANAKVQQEWTDYDTDSQEYRDTIADVLAKRGTVERQALAAQQQLAEAERSVERQSVALGTELEQVKALQSQLQQQRQGVDHEIRELVKKGVMADALDDLHTKAAQLDSSLELITNKAAVLTAEQTALTQKRTLLTAQNEVILAEQRLLDAYIKDPDADTSNLEAQLQDARAALAEAQRLAEAAEAASKLLNENLQELKTDLLAQNDEHLTAAREHQAILRTLVEKTQLNLNYTLEAARKQREVNDLELQVLVRLQQAADAGYDEAKALLEVAHHSGIATAAEIYYRDYSDLAGDRGGKCTKGLARPEDRMLADNYYREMLAHRELQRRAQAQADSFRQTKEAAQADMQRLQGQQEIAAKRLNELNNYIATTQEEIDTKQQELVIAQIRLEGISRIRQQTEQTFIQLVTLEKLNLAQAQLEQEIAQKRQENIEEAVKARMERDRLELERQRLETTAKIEQLRSLQAEDSLRQSLNNVRGQLGMATLDPTEDSAQLQSQLAGLLTDLKNLETENTDLPDDLKALLAEARGDLNLALQGKEASTIQQNLLNAMAGLLEQVDLYKTEIDRIDLQEQADNELLQKAQQDLQGASQELLKELERSGKLGELQDQINPQYIETLSKVALAEQAVEITEELGKQAKGMLEQIIKQRVAERKARKKSFWQKVLGFVQNAIGILGTILSFVPGLNLIGVGLLAANAGISAIRSAINGDWMGAIFSVVTGALDAFTAGMASHLSTGAKLALQTFKAVAGQAYGAARNIMSGDKIMGFLQIIGAVASAASAGMQGMMQSLSDTAQKVITSVVDSLKQAPQMIYSGIKAAENGNWIAAIDNIFNAALNIGGNFIGNFKPAALNILERISQVGNSALAIASAIEGGSFNSILSALQRLGGIWSDELKDLAGKIFGGLTDFLPGNSDNTTFESCQN